MTAVRITERRVEVEVSGGTLRGALWNESARGAPVLAIHGITANHMSFHGLAERLDAPVLALDLRGRGHSREVGAPFGLVQHAADMAAAIHSLGWSGVRVAGHSMGAFAGVRLAAAHPGLVSQLTLIDGGLPIEAEGELRPEDVLGPAIERLSRHFSSRDEYRSFWRTHPAFGPYWNAQIERYVDYDLVPVGQKLRPAAMPEAVVANMQELDGRGGYTEALESLNRPFTLFTSPRGLLDERPGLYTAAWVAHWEARLPNMEVIEVPSTNHYTVLLSGAVRAVAERIEEDAS